jgi:CubicO group peptidase (beta-lactamase class C family)
MLRRDGFFLILFFCTSALTFSQTASGQTITALNPTSVIAGSQALTLTVHGEGLKKKAKVQWNGATLVTTRLSSHELTALVPAELMATAGAAQITVNRKGVISNAVTFTIHNSPQPSPGYDWSQLRNRLESFVPDRVFGLGLMIARNDQVVYAEAFGIQNVDAVLPIASSTKMPSGTVIMKLVEQGLINLDEPIATYLQGKINVPAEKAGITVRMLFNHTSGVIAEPLCANNVLTTLKACAQEALNAPLEFTPGTKFAYGGGGMQVAGFIAEAVTGKKFTDLFDEIVARPLGLTRFRYNSTTNPHIAGGALSDIGDYTKILQMQLAGGIYQGNRILSQATIDEMQRDQIAGLEKLRTPGKTTLTGYSFGWWHSDPAYLSQQAQPQTVGPELSDQGLFGSTPWIDKDLNYSAVLLIFNRTQTGTEIWNDIRPLIVAQIKKNP